MRKALALTLLGMFLAVPAYSQEALGPAAGAVANLEPGFPTVIADTTPTPATQFEVGVAGGYSTGSPLGTYETLLVQVNYGVVDAVQARVAWDWIIGEGKVDGNADATLGLLWAPIAEQDVLPSMGIEVSARVPTGDGFTGYDGSIVGVATKTVGQARFHFNAGYTTIGDSTSTMMVHTRNDTDVFALGMDYPLLDSLVFVTDIYSAEARYEGANRVEMLEAGLRWMLSDMDTLSFGVGVCVGNGNMTPDFTAVLGYQRCL